MYRRRDAEICLWDFLHIINSLCFYWPDLLNYAAVSWASTGLMFFTFQKSMCVSWWTRICTFALDVCKVGKRLERRWRKRDAEEGSARLMKYNIYKFITTDKQSNTLAYIFQTSYGWWRAVVVHIKVIHLSNYCLLSANLMSAVPCESAYLRNRRKQFRRFYVTFVAIFVHTRDWS